MCKKTSIQDLKESTPENWKKLFKKAHQSDLIQLKLNETMGPVRSRAAVELDRRKMNLDRVAIIVAVLSMLISAFSMVIAVSS